MLACVTQKYSRSSKSRFVSGSSIKCIFRCLKLYFIALPYSREELKLADELKKPIIPLLLEVMKWPPEKPMAEVFAPLTYVPFHLEPKHQDDWNCPQFNHLLEKIASEKAPRKERMGTNEADNNGGKPKRSKCWLCVCLWVSKWNERHFSLCDTSAFHLCHPLTLSFKELILSSMAEWVGIGYAGGDSITDLEYLGGKIWSVWHLA